MKSPCSEKRCGPCPVGYIFEEYGEDRGEIVARAVEVGVESIPAEARNDVPRVHEVMRESVGPADETSFQNKVEVEIAALGVVLALQGSCDQRPQFSRY